MQIDNLIDQYDEPKNSKVELSIIVPCRSENWEILAFTLQSIQEEARYACGNNYECLVVFNSLAGEHSEGEEKFKTSNFRRFGNFRYVHIKTPGAWQARNAGVVSAIGTYVWIGDSHLLLGRDLFSGLIFTYNNLIKMGHKVGILHSALAWLSGVHERDLREEYTPQLKTKFWGSWHKSHVKEPHPICMSGTSFLMERKVLDKVGLWNPHFTAYGGGEPYMNLKMWRMGYEVWTDPSYYVWHLAAKRGYSWTSNGFWFNTLLAAYTIGGDSWLENQENNYINLLESRHTGTTLTVYKNKLLELKNEVILKGSLDKEWIDNKSIYTLDELIAKHGWE